MRANMVRNNIVTANSILIRLMLCRQMKAIRSAVNLKDFRLTEDSLRASFNDTIFRTRDCHLFRAV